MSKMEFILQALTYKQIGKIIYTSAHSNLNQALDRLPRGDRAGRRRHRHVSGLRRRDAAGVQGGDAKAGIPVATYAWGYVSGPGKNYTTVVGEDTCKLGKAYAKVMNKQVKSGEIAFLGGFPGNPLSPGWQKCERPALNKNIKVVATEPTNWDPSKVQQVVVGHPRRASRTSRAGATSTASAWRRARSRRTRPRASRSTPC